MFFQLLPCFSQHFGGLLVVRICVQVLTGMMRKWMGWLSYRFSRFCLGFANLTHVQSIFYQFIIRPHYLLKWLTVSFYNLCSFRLNLYISAFLFLFFLFLNIDIHLSTETTLMLFVCLYTSNSHLSINISFVNLHELLNLCLFLFVNR